MSAELGNLSWAEWVEFATGNTGTVARLPLAKGQPVIRRPLIPFGAAVQGGGGGETVSQILPSITWTGDLSGGIALRDYDETKGFTSYHRGTLDTRDKQGITLPPKVTSHGAGAAGLYAAGWRVSGYRTGFAQDFALLWHPDVTQGYLRNLTTSVWVVVPFAALAVTGFCQHNGCYFLSTPNGIYQNSTATGWLWALIAGSPLNLCGLTTHDGKVYAFSTATNLLTFTTDPVAVAWAAVPGSQPFRAQPNETPRDVVRWRDKRGDEALYLLTSQRLMGFDEEPGEWVEAESWADLAPDATPTAQVWGRDNNLYVAPVDATGTDNHAFVFQLTGATDEVGPKKRGGLDTTYVNNVCMLASSVHWLFAWGGNAAGNGGQCLAYNEEQGWHPMLDLPSEGFAVVPAGGGYWRGWLFTLLSNGTLLSQRVPDRLEILPRSAGSDTLTERRLYTAYTDCGHPNRWKIAHYLVADPRMADGSSGMPVLSSGKLGILADASLPASQHYASFGNVGAYPLVIPLPRVGTVGADGLSGAPSITDGVGLPFRRAQLFLALTGGAANPAPVIASFGLYYSFWDEMKYSYQLLADLTDDNLKRWHAEGRWPHGDRATLAAALHALIAGRQRFSMTFGSADRRVVVSAVDLQLSSRESDAGGMYNLSCRDISPPASG